MGALALWRLAKGLSGGGWGGTGWRVLTSPRTVTAALFAAAVGIGIWAVAATDSIAVGLSRAGLIVSGFGLRGAWLVAVTIVAAALIALLLLVRVHGVSALKRLWFTEVATTAISTLFVALVGAILIGGIGAVAYSTATDATWGERAPDVRCLAEPTSWDWSTDCGKLGEGWGPLADAMGRDLEEAGRAAGRRRAAPATPRSRSRTRARATTRWPRSPPSRRRSTWCATRPRRPRRPPRPRRPGGRRTSTRSRPAPWRGWSSSSACCCSSPA